MTDTWPLPKLTRAYNRAFADERDSLSPDAVTAGETVGRFLFALSDKGTFLHARTRADAVSAIDAFADARRAVQ